MFIPGETIEHEFIIPFVASEISKVVITYKQNDRLILTKPISSGFEQASLTSTRIVLTLSQKESLLFDGTSNYTVQINVFLRSGGRATSREIHSSLEEQHYKKVITNG